MVRPATLRPRNIHQALVWLLASVIVPLLLGALVLLVAESRQERQLARIQLSTLAQILVQAVDSELDQGLAQLQAISLAPAIDKKDWRELHRYAAGVTQARPGSLIALVGPGGQQIFNTVTPWGSPQPNLWRLGDERPEVTWEGRSLPLSSQNLTREVFSSGQVVYSDLYYGLTIKRPTLALSVPVVRHGRVAYALTLSFPPARLEQLVSAAVTIPGLRVLVVDRRGRVVAANAASSYSLADSVIPVAAGARAGHFEIQSPNGSPMVGAYAVSTKNGFQVRVVSPRQLSVFATSRSASAGWMALVVAALTVSLLMATLLGRRVARPLRKLAQFAREGHYPPQRRPSGIEEIDALDQALRLGAEAQRRRGEELVISARRAEAEASLRSAARQKDEFLATLAHELRNPLAPIRNSVEVIRRNSSAGPAVQRAVEVIERQLAHLTRLVDDLLDVSRITLGTVQLRKEALDLRGVVSGAADSLAPAVEAAGLVLTQLLPEHAICVDGDRTRLAQCVVNVLNNAIKFTPAGGRIQLRVGLDGPNAIVEVTDSGVGVAAASLERIFEPFVQEHLSGVSGNTGLGIGLALTRKLIVLHAGTVHALSEGPGKGTTVRIELPALPASRTVAEPPPQLPASPQSEPEGEAGIETSGARVLVVDDNDDAAVTMSDMLSLSGFHCQVAHTGESAVRAVRQDAPEAVLLDIGLPDIDGYEVCRRIRSAGGRPPVLIALTGWGQEKDRLQAEQAGFDAHLTKPADPYEVIALINSLVAKRLKR